jgi:hypothetical protein
LKRGFPSSQKCDSWRASLEEAPRPPSAVPSFLTHFSALNDPRQSAKVLYLLLLLSATIAGADDFVEVALWG